MTMVASHLIWLLRTRDMRKRAKENDQSFDESEECIEWQSKGIDLEGMFGRLFSETDKPHNNADHGYNGSESLVEPQIVVPKTVPNAII
jgi:hypothetical protein